MQLSLKRGAFPVAAAVAVCAALVAVVGAAGPAAGAGLSGEQPAPLFVLVTEPADGLSPIYGLITSAKRTLEMTMYELSDATAETDLARDAERGVKVEVVLDQNLAKSFNTPAYDYLQSHGVSVHWAPRSYDVTHQKTITVDGDVSAVMTLKLTSEYYATSRDFALVDRDAADVGAIRAVFDGDFAGSPSSPEPAGSDLIWSPGADERLVGIIGSARHTLYVENEEMSEYTVVDALAAAARRGVDVEVVMTYQSSWRSDFDKLAEAGVHVRTYSPDADLYIHAKVIDVDPGSPDEHLEIGSQNFSWASLQYNRELGVDLGPAQAGIVGSVAATVRSDFAGGEPWTA
jgi:phosphatidylserine/phosphatidylglycerophosphate/cardiolipin synthase-like enzyme